MLFLALKLLPYVRVAMIHIATKWQDIGLYLNVEQSKIEGIRHKCRRDHDKSLTEVLAEWLRNPNPKLPHTWRTVVAVMAYRVAGDHPNEALKVAEMYQGKWQARYHLYLM